MLFPGTFVARKQTKQPDVIYFGGSIVTISKLFWFTVISVNCIANLFNVGTNYAINRDMQ